MAAFVAGLPGPGSTLPPLPGSLEEDLDLREGGRDGGGGSPAKKAKNAGDKVAAGQSGEASASVNIGVTTLQMLLAQQSAQLLEAQTANLTRALGEMEQKTNHKIDSLADKIDASTSKVQKVEDDLKGTLARIAALEQHGGPGKASGGEGRRNTLVFGGWVEAPRKGIVLDPLKQCLDHLNLTEKMDSDPFCTGPRRAVALANFHARQDESASDLRRRMLEIIQEINKASLQLQGGKRALWASFSRTPAERGRASVAGSIKKVVMNHRANLVGELDMAYNQGCAWLGDLQVAGMGPRAEGSVARQVDTRAGEAWIDEVAISKFLKVSRQTIEDEISRHRY